MKILLFILLTFFNSAFGFHEDFLHINQTCESLRANSNETIYFQNIKNKESIAVTKTELIELCELSRESSNSYSHLKSVSFNPSRKWKVTITFGPFIAFYHKTDLYFRNSDTNIQITGIEPVQRTSFGHYKVLDSDETNIGQFLDEPQNRLSIEFSNDQIFFGIEYLHPKIVYHQDNQNSNVAINGTFNGEHIDVQNVNLSDYFYQITSTFGNATVEFYAGKIHELLKNSRHSLRLHSGVGVGLAFARGTTSQIFNGNEMQFINDIDGNGIQVIGYSASLRNRLRFNPNRSRFGFSLAHDLAYTEINGQLGDFDSNVSLLSHRISFGISYDLFSRKKKKKKKN